ncbi:Ig-like domain-containing protein [uncultured Aquimarina sp.]|uniref:Ig-like domain-containing protein n=1 Tax=uncultured Aquimarina sp. TaxID=575652 RepID=UPI002608ECEA|nr:Ig-like domain-containing protein [uncultured Aquimarina sp.]
MKLLKPKKESFHFRFWKEPLLILFSLFVSFTWGQVNTGGSATTSDHQKEVIGYITNWDAWKAASAGVPSAGALTQLNIDYSKYTILNYSFFGVAVDGSLHSGDLRNKQIHQPGTVQQPADLLYGDVYSSWDFHILFGEIEPIQWINEDVKQRAEALGFQVAVGGNTWNHPEWGLSGVLPLPLPKEGSDAKGLLELAKANGVKVMASIGGWSMCKHFPEMAADPVKRARFIEDCKKLINMGFDGIDLDWEYPGPFPGMNFTGTNADYANFENLVQEIRNAIGPDKLITAAMAADYKKIEGFNWSKLVNTMDYFNMMTYDFNGGWSNIAGHNAPVYPYDGAEAPEFNWQTLLEKMTGMGVPSNKINFGAPFYGRGVITDGAADLNAPTVKRNVTIQPDGPVSTAADYTNWPQEVYDGTPNHFFIKQKTGSGSGWTRKWDDQAKVPYMVKGNFFLSYDDDESIAIKAQFINDNNLAGTIVWTVFGDLEFSGSSQSFGTKLKRWSNVKSPLINKMNEVFASGDTGNRPPTVSITSPSQGSTFEAGNEINITANATDDVSVARVEFYNGTTLLGEDTTSPYSYTWNSVAVGNYSIIAKVYDNEGVSNTDSVSISVANGNNQLPVVVINSPNEGDSFSVGTIITISSEASDADGTIAKVEFFDGEVLLGEDIVAPYSFDWANAGVGSHSIKVTATDNENGVSSESVSITVTGSDNPCTRPPYVAGQIYVNGDEVSYQGNEYRAKWWTQNNDPVTNRENVWELIGPCGDVSTAPQVTITSPSSGQSFLIGNVVTINANASDADGTITKVEFYVDDTMISEDTSAPYTTNWTALEGNHTITASATDNDNNVTTSTAVSITVTNDDNTPPTISITSNGTSFNTGESVDIQANANDSDGNITKVSFYVDGNMISEDTSAPYSANWTAIIGNHVLTATATDNEGASGTSTAINITVNTDGGGECNEPQYVENGGYVAGSIVQNNGNKYECKPHPFTGWCNGAAWAYSPGEGSYWQDAWTLLGECDGGNTGENEAPTVSISQPANGQSFTVGSTITINASASDTDGNVTKVEFFRNGTLLETDTTSPYSFTWNNASTGNYTLTAKATDDDNATGESTVNISVGSVPPPPTGGDLPKRILVGYWHNFNNGSSIPKLRDVSDKWDVVNVSFAIPKVQLGADMEFIPDNSIYSSTQEFKDDVRLLQSRGQKVLISMGGATGAVDVDNSSDAQIFSSSMTNIINEYGFDGMDIDFEGTSIALASGDTSLSNPTSPKVVNLITAFRSILSQYDMSKFILSMAPETAYVQGGIGQYGGIWGAYLPLIYALRTEMDYIHVQHYNTGSMLALDGKAYSAGTADFHVAMAEVLLQGFTLSTGEQFPALRPNQVAIGLPASPSAAGSGYTAPAEVHKALDYIIKGQSFGGSYTMVKPSGYADFRGLMTWSINWDIVAGFGFSNPHRIYLDALDQRAPEQILEKESLKMYPNPFTSKVNITFKLSKDKLINAVIYNQIGVKVAVLKDNEKLSSGNQNIQWDTNGVPSGIYFLKLRMGKEVKTMKLIKQ